MPLFLTQVPIEEYSVKGRPVVVYRADEVPQPPLAPYLKMIELFPFLQTLARKGYKTIGYYAVKESEWVESVPTLAASVGMSAVIGIARTKILPAYAERISEHLHLLSPNIYAVNFSRTKKHVDSLPGGFMAPMGLECQEVVDGLQSFLDKSPLPPCDNIIVPTGSGVALAGIINHLRGRGKVYAVCTRPTKSVRKVIDKYTKQSNVELIANDPYQTPLEYTRWPMHEFWEQNAYRWLAANIKGLTGLICFVNLGRGSK